MSLKNNSMFFNNTIRFYKHWLHPFFLIVICAISSFAQAPSQTYWWNDAVFYQVFVRSFKDSDGDGNGDLKGLIEKLDYLNDGDANTTDDLGITGLWLMPIQQSPSYHGYDVTDYRTVEQDYGTNEDFKNFINEAHKRGIKVIIDFVMNHTSSQHPWFQSSVDPLSDKHNWYIWNSSNPNVKGPWNQTVWYPKNGSYYYGIFWSEMPDLNYNTPEVKTEMFANAKFWLEDMNVDGFRLDAIKYIFENGNVMEDTPETKAFWKDFTSYYKSVNENAYSVGEAWTVTEKIKDYVNNKGLDNCFEFDLASAIVNAANTGNNSGLQTQVEKSMLAYPFLQFSTFLTNHDMNRVMDQLGKNTGKAKVAADLLLTLPGVPYIYYGEEIGMIGSGADENKRTPLQWNSDKQAGFTSGTPWRNLNADFGLKNIENQKQDANSLWQHYKNLITIRNNELALRRGNYKSVTTSTNSAFAFLRQFENESVLVITNTSSNSISNIHLSVTQGDILPGTYNLIELQSGNQVPLKIDNTTSITDIAINQILPQSTLIYKLTVPTSIYNPLDNILSVFHVSTDKEIFINYSEGLKGIVYISVVDLLGEEKITSSFTNENNGGQHRLSCEGLVPGVYLLTLNNIKENKIFKIVIK